MMNRELNPYEAPQTALAEEQVPVADASISDRRVEKRKRIGNPLVRGLAIDLLLMFVLIGTVGLWEPLQFIHLMFLLHVAVSLVFMVKSTIRKTPLSQFQITFIRWGGMVLIPSGIILALLLKLR